MKKWWWGAAACVMAASVAYGAFVFYKQPPDTRNEEAAMEISAENLAHEFSVSESVASKKFTDKILIVTGSVTEVNTSSSGISISLSGEVAMSGVTCSFYADERKSVKLIKPGDLIHVKGKCTGMLTDVILNNCSISSH